MYLKKDKAFNQAYAACQCGLNIHRIACPRSVHTSYPLHPLPPPLSHRIANSQCLLHQPPGSLQCLGLRSLCLLGSCEARCSIKSLTLHSSVSGGCSRVSRGTGSLGSLYFIRQLFWLNSLACWTFSSFSQCGDSTLGPRCIQELRGP